jgi:hypothetical protein
MAFQPVPNTAEVRLKYAASTVLAAENVFYVRDTIVGWTVAKLNSLATTVSTWWNANVKPLQHSGIVLTEITCRDLGAEFGNQGGAAVGTAGTRADTSGRAPYNTAAIIQWYGDFGSAPPRGWSFHIGLVDGDQSETGIVTATATALDSAYTALAPAINSAVGTEAQVLVSRYLNGALRAAGVTNTLRDVRVRAANLGTIRRRLR